MMLSVSLNGSPRQNQEFEFDGGDLNFMQSSLDSSSTELSIAFKQCQEGLKSLKEEAELVDQDFAQQVQTQIGVVQTCKRQF